MVGVERDVWASATIMGGGDLNLIRFQIQTDSIEVQIISKFDRSKNGLPDSKNLK
jgi:hypothetical protein